MTRTYCYIFDQGGVSCRRMEPEVDYRIDSRYEMIEISGDSATIFVEAPDETASCAGPTPLRAEAIDLVMQQAEALSSDWSNNPAGYAVC